MPTRRQCANAIRALAIDAIEKSRSGHPGAPLGMADMAEALWRHGFKHNPANPGWMDRDRFVLSNGHASMLLYAVLHLTGYDLSMDDIRNFRQLGSRTPGHPECDVTPGVEMTTGPLGQGISSAVGMTLAEKMLATRFNTPEHTVIDHHTYVFLGDGCLMEGVSHEACSLAGVWGLGKLIALYDSNGISIDGKIDGWFTEDVAARYKAYGWQVIGPVDGHDAEALDAARSEQPELFDDLATAYARAHNLADASLGCEVDAALLGESERALLSACEQGEQKVVACVEASDFAGACSALAELREPIDRFFEDVLVMDEDTRVRENRLRLLNRFASVFADVANIGALSRKK